MFAYHIRMALLSLRQAPILSALMVGLIGLGVGISMTTLTLYYMMSSDPIPHKSGQLYNVRIDSWDKDEPWDDDEPDTPPAQLTYTDAMGLRELAGPVRRAAMFKGVFTVAPRDRDVKPFAATSRMTDRDFFAMFEVPFLYGGAWSMQDDADARRVVVLHKQTNIDVFGGENSVGRKLTLGETDYEVVGVLDDWQPKVTYYDLNNGSFGDTEDLYMPFSLARLGNLERSGNTNCWGTERPDSWEGFLRGNCVWIQFWFEAKTAAQRETFRANLEGYVAEQKNLGRLPRDMNNRLDDVNAWLKENKVVGSDDTVLVGLSFLFLMVCLFNAIGLLLARFVGKSTVIGIRRALGASKSAIFRQHLVEVGLIGFCGGILGLLISWLGLRSVQSLYDDYEKLAHLDPTMVTVAFVIAVSASIVAGLYPTWRVCQTSPATYLKS